MGTPRSGRSQSRFAATVGYFVNLVVLRGDLSGEPSFVALLERTKEAVAADFAHGDYPLPLLAEHLQPERDASRTPLFQVSFVLQKETRGVEGLTAFALGEEGVEVGSADLRLASLALADPPAPFDLQLHAVERQGGLSLGLQYNSDLFDATTAARLMERFAALLESIAADPAGSIAELALLSGGGAPPAAAGVERYRRRRRSREERGRGPRGEPVRAVRGAGGADAGGPGAGRRRGAAELRGAGGADGGTGASPAGVGGGAGGAGGDLPAAPDGAGGGAARDGRGGRVLRPARSRLSGGAGALHAGGQPLRRGADDLGAGGAAARSGGERGVDRPAR